MGDIADMILDGILDEQTGEYIGYKPLSFISVYAFRHGTGFFNLN